MCHFVTLFGWWIQDCFNVKHVAQKRLKNTALDKGGGSSYPLSPIAWQLILEIDFKCLLSKIVFIKTTLYWKLQLISKVEKKGHVNCKRSGIMSWCCHPEDTGLCCRCMQKWLDSTIFPKVQNMPAAHSWIRQDCDVTNPHVWAFRQSQKISSDPSNISMTCESSYPLGLYCHL